MEIANVRVWWTRSVEGRARNSASAWVGCCDCIYIYIYLWGEPLRRLRAQPLPPNTTHNLETARSFGFLLDLPVPQEFKYFFCGIFESQIGKSSVWREGLTHHF